jgi:hypothetical protein
MNRKAGINLLVHAATAAIQQWARDIKGMRMGILIVIHTFGADMKWHPHIHLIVTAGGLSDRPQISHVPRGAKKTMEVSGHHPNEESPS